MILETLELFRIGFGNRPLLLTFGALVVLSAVGRARRYAALPLSWTDFAPRLLAVAAFVGLVGYVLIAVWYSSIDQYFDPAEPTITAVGWLFHAGKAVYHTLDAAERYAHIYGPAVFMAHGVVLGWLGPSIVLSKALGVTAALAALALLFGALRSEVSALRAMLLTGVCALILLAFRNYSFWTRPEPLELLCVAAALLAVSWSAGGWTAFAMGVCAGVLCNLKLTGPFYLLPVAVILQQRAGWRPTIGALVTALVVAVVPFLAYSNISLGNYVAWIRLSAQSGLQLGTLRLNIEWAIFLSLPILLSSHVVRPAARPSGRDWRLRLLAFAASTGVVVLAASKPGAGPYHLIPLVPVIVYFVACNLKNTSLRDAADPRVAQVSIAFAAVMVALAVAEQAQFLSTMTHRAYRDETTDVKRFVSGRPGMIVEMGYGSSEVLSLGRPVLIFRNNSYFLDQPAIREHQLAGLALPRATIQALRECVVNDWLIPKGEHPFSGRNAYEAVLGEPLFSDEFQRVFRRSHRLTATTRYFDVWHCVPEPSR